MKINKKVLQQLKDDFVNVGYELGNIYSIMPRIEALDASETKDELMETLLHRKSLCEDKFNKLFKQLHCEHTETEQTLLKHEYHHNYDIEGTVCKECDLVLETF